MRKSTINVLLIVAAIAVFAVALVIGLEKGEFGGTDATASEEISEVDPEYEPWFTPFWEQPGGEVESGLFALQAGIGGGILGFALGVYRERRKHLGSNVPAREPSPADQS